MLNSLLLNIIFFKICGLMSVYNTRSSVMDNVLNDSFFEENIDFEEVKDEEVLSACTDAHMGQDAPITE